MSYRENELLVAAQDLLELEEDLNVLPNSVIADAFDTLRDAVESYD